MRTPRKSRPGTPATYVERVNLAIDHIVDHLDQPLRLTSIARVAGLSPYHFHRVFQAIVGETPADFAKRLRLDRALAMMATRPRSSHPLTRIALDCGFSSSSDFTRSFKQRFGAAPSRFGLDAWRELHRRKLEAIVSGATQRPYVRELSASPGRNTFAVRIRDLPPRTVAYIRVAKPYAGDGVLGACQRLVAWAERHGCADRQWLGYQWDNPELVPLERCVYHVAVEADRVPPRGEIGRFTFPAMTVAQVEVRGGIDLELRVLQWLYGSWLPRSGYVPDDHPCFEAWIGRPFAHGTGHFELDIQLPIRRG